jgi:hypothetical protein
MTLHDKFDIIENHLKNEKTKKVEDKIENFLENYLNSDIKVLVPDYIKQSIFFHKFIFNYELNINFQEYIKKHLIQHRNNFRSFIKKEMLKLSDITKFIKNYIFKIQKIQTILNFHSDLVKYSYTMLNTLIITDSIILIFIEEQVTSFNKDIKELLHFVKKIDSDNMYLNMIKLFGSIYKKKIMNDEYLPIPINYRRLQKLNNTIKYYHDIHLFYYSFKENITDLTLPIFKLILIDLIEIVKYNSLEEIEYVFNQNWKFILNVKTYKIDDKQEIILNLSNELINRTCPLKTYQDIKTILKIGKYLLELIKNICYDKYSLFMSKMSLTIIQFFDPDENEHKVINYMNNYIHNLVMNKEINDIKTAVDFTNSLANLDYFLDVYYDFLVKRLTTNLSLLNKDDFEIYITLEKDIINLLSKIKNPKMLYKLNKVVTDTYTSYFENLDFNSLSNKLLKTNISVMTSSYNNWGISHSEGLIDYKIVEEIKDTQLGKYLKYYDLYYVDKYNKHRVINWFPHFGEITITYLGQQLKMLPIQFMIIEMFTNTDEILINDIMKSKILINYSEKFKTDLINSIIFSGLFVINNQTIYLSKSESIKNDLIEIFLNTSEYPSIWEKQKEIELAYSRNEIINTVINHTIKICSKSKLELYPIIQKEITLFKLNEEMFEKSLKYLIDMDYIILNEKNEYEKLF